MRLAALLLFELIRLPRLGVEIATPGVTVASRGAEDTLEGLGYRVTLSAARTGCDALAPADLARTAAPPLDLPRWRGPFFTRGRTLVACTPAWGGSLVARVEHDDAARPQVEAVLDAVAAAVDARPARPWQLLLPITGVELDLSPDAGWAIPPTGPAKSRGQDLLVKVGTPLVVGVQLLPGDCVDFAQQRRAEGMTPAAAGGWPGPYRAAGVFRRVAGGRLETLACARRGEGAHVQVVVGGGRGDGDVAVADLVLRQIARAGPDEPSPEDPGERSPVGTVIGRLYLGAFRLRPEPDTIEGQYGARAGLDLDFAVNVGGPIAPAFGLGGALGVDGAPHLALDLHLAAGVSLGAGPAHLMLLGVVGTDRTGPGAAEGTLDLDWYAGGMATARLKLGRLLFDASGMWANRELRARVAAGFVPRGGVRGWSAGVELLDHDAGRAVMAYVAMVPP